jgi:hypothetical protein
LVLSRPVRAEPLPEENRGIAARYPGDAGIGSDPAVVFADAFESYNSAEDLLRSRWNEVRHIANIRFTTEPNLFGRSKVLEFTVPKQSDEFGDALEKTVSPARDLLFLRYYAKFDSGFNVLGPTDTTNFLSAMKLGEESPLPPIPAISIFISTIRTNVMCGATTSFPRAASYLSIEHLLTLGQSSSGARMSYPSSGAGTVTS